MMTKMEEAGRQSLKITVRPKILIGAMMANGCNCFRLRLFVNPEGRGGVIQDVPYTVATGQTNASRLPARFLCWISLFRHLGRPRQTNPSLRRGETLSFDDLTKKKSKLIRAEVITNSKNKTPLPDMGSGGVTKSNPGFIWPDGKLTGKDPMIGLDFHAAQGRYPRCSQFDFPGTRHRLLSICLRRAISAKTDWFLSNLEKYGVSYDIIGQSFYPIMWHGTMKELEENLARRKKKFNKDIFVVETAYPYKAVENFESRADHLDAMVGKKVREGQKAFLDELIQDCR